MKQQTILTVTVNPAIDKFASVAKVAPERKLRCSEPTFDCGGGGLNVARAVTRLGGTAHAAFLRGGPIGDMIECLLKRERIPYTPHPIRSWSRENLAVLETSTGRQFRFGMPGPRVRPSEWRSFLASLPRLKPRADWVVLSGSTTEGVPADFYARAAAAFAKRGSRVVVDTSGKPLHHLSHRGVYLLKVNLNELNELVGGKLSLKSKAEAARAARQVLGKVAGEAIVVTLNADGAMLVTRLSTQHFTSPNVKVRSVIGAGDSLVGGMVLSMARGLSLEAAVRYGVASGTAAVTTAGTELCRLRMTQQILPKIRIRPVAGV